MNVSSRTPGGSRGRCPVCGQLVCIDSSEPLGDAPCPACGTLLWFIQIEDETRLFDPGDDAMVERIARHLGIAPDDLRTKDWNELGLDSLDLVELMMEFDEDAPE